MKPYYEESGIIVYNADCREIIPALAPIDLVLTDPPYGVALEGSSWDRSIPLPMEWLYPLLGKAKTLLITCGNGNQHHYPQPNWTMAWFRPGSVQRVRRAGGFSHWEPILLYGENPFAIDAKQFPANNPDANNGHPCPKPLSLFRWLIKESKATEVVDPFMGSGTTLKAAKELGVKAIGIEINEAYCEIAVNRLRQGVLQFT